MLSRHISESQVFPGLEISLLEEAWRRSRDVDQAQVGAWLLQQFQACLRGAFGLRPYNAGYTITKS
jgi:hypothetical protein